MKYKWTFIFFSCIFILILSGLLFAGWRRGQMIQNTHYKPYKWIQHRLSNGMEVLLVQEKALPSISFELMFKVGAKQDPKGQEGLAYLLAELIDKGSKKRSAKDLTDDLELLGTGFSYSLGYDAVSFSTGSIMPDLHKDLLGILAEIIKTPALLEEEFKRAQEKALGWVKRSPENFSFYTSRVFNKRLYKTHPYGFYKYGSVESLKAITLKDVRRFYEQYFTPSQAVLTVAGRYPDNILSQLEALFGSWKADDLAKGGVKGDEGDDLAKGGLDGLSKAGDVSFAKGDQSEEQGKDQQGSAPVVSQKELLIVDHPFAVQSEIRMGHLSVKSAHPDFLALRVANIILGGSSGSRLTSRLRGQRGLTYHVQSTFSGKRDLGAFKIGMAVRNSKVGAALLELIGVVEDFHKNGITEKELDKAKKLLQNGFITGISTADSVASFLLHLKSQGRPYSEMEDYFSKLENLTLEQVNISIKKHLHPKQLELLILTNAGQVESQLKDFEPWQVKNYKHFL